MGAGKDGCVVLCISIPLEFDGRKPKPFLKYIQISRSQINASRYDVYYQYSATDFPYIVWHSVAFNYRTV